MKGAIQIAQWAWHTKILQAILSTFDGAWQVEFDSSPEVKGKLTLDEKVTKL